MKAFKKWWLAQSQTKYYEEMSAEDGWRAALEWAKIQATDIQTTELERAIEQELEETGK